MTKIKQLLNEEIEITLPANFAVKMQDRVMHRIMVPVQVIKPTSNKADFKENILLVLCFFLFSVLIYVFGFNKSYSVSISVPKDMMLNFMIKFTSGVVILYFIVNEYFERKKKYLF
jgi:hypothetical protein